MTGDSPASDTANPQDVGYTDNPEADIAAHRRNAQLTRVFGILGFVGAVTYAYFSGSTAVPIFAGLAWAGWANWAATNLEKQALGWEAGLR